MHISWHGQYTVKIQSETAALVIDPYAPTLGLAPFRAKADLVSLSNPASADMSHVDAIQGEPYVINTPGEYSVRGLTLYALGWHDEETNAEKNIQLWNIEKISLLHIGALNRELTDRELQELERRDIDVLLLPVGGGSGLNTQQALHIVTVVEPRMIIPIHYALPGLKEELQPVDAFAREMGINPAERQPKVIIKANKLPSEEVTTVLLSA